METSVPHQVADMIAKSLGIDAKHISVIHSNRVQEGVSILRLVVARTLASRELTMTTDVSDYMISNTSTEKLMCFIRYICRPHADHISPSRLLPFLYIAIANASAVPYSQMVDLTKVSAWVNRLVNQDEVIQDDEQDEHKDVVAISVDHYNNNPRHLMVEIPYSTRSGVMNHIICCPQCASETCHNDNDNDNDNDNPRQVMVDTHRHLTHKGKLIMTRLTKSAAIKTTNIAIFECCGQVLAKSDLNGFTLLSSRCSSE